MRLRQLALRRAQLLLQLGGRRVRNAELPAQGGHLLDQPAALLGLATRLGDGATGGLRRQRRGTTTTAAAARGRLRDGRGLRLAERLRVRGLLPALSLALLVDECSVSSARSRFSAS